MSSAGPQPEYSDEYYHKLLEDLERALAVEQHPATRFQYQEEIKRLDQILDRRKIRAETASVPAQPTEKAGPTEVFTGDVDRAELFESLLELARARDIVFAVGGVGSGLSTFHNQFLDYVQEMTTARTITGVDFDCQKFDAMFNARQGINEVLRKHGATHLGEDQLDLKCLLASLAHSAYMALRDSGFEKELENVLPPMHVDPNQFLTYYFTHSQAMASAARGPILDYFFSTLQCFAQATGTENILVFIPWLGLASCFHSSEVTHKRLGQHLWEALGEVAGSRKGQSSSKNGPPPISAYDKVCLVVACRHVPYGHATYMPTLVSWSVWPLPSFTRDESRKLLGQISHGLASDDAANGLLKCTGGSPWLTRYVLSYVGYVYESQPGGDAVQLIQHACKVAGERLRLREENGPVDEFAHSYIERIRSTLERGEATDTRLLDAWTGRKRRDGINVNPRVEAFIASGLAWLEGEVWNKGQPNFVFRRYPTVYFQEPGTLARIAYEVATEHTLPAMAS